ncbi:MAG: flagellar hook-associated protein FlgK [Campylobacterota bacterium]|nr:flagellar hook-associated protein FlgK [Campylobacterota bacterium]
MASIFNALHIGYSGLNASQVGINTTGHNISNAETEGYTRQRVSTAAATPITIVPGDRGNGVVVQDILRVFDSFVYDRYTKTAEDKEYSDFTRETMETLSTYFPEIEDVGIKADLHTYFDLWQSFADNPENNAMKIALAAQTETLSLNIQQTREEVRGLQDQLNDQLNTAISEVNRIGAEIAELNKAIETSELGYLNNANDLRDQRNLLELSLAKLIGSDVFGGELVSDMSVDRHVAENAEHYNVHIGGFNFVDGVTFHPIGITNEFNPEGFHDLYYERQDGVRIPFSSEIQDGRVGAILDMRGSALDEVTGTPVDGTLQDVLNQLDAFAAGLIESTNNLYAQSATQSMQSNSLELSEDMPLVNSDLNFSEGTFDVVAYDIDGNETARRTIIIDHQTAMGDSSLYEGDVGFDPSTIIGQLRVNSDDNDDNNAINDIDDLLQSSYSENGGLSISVKDPSSGYTFAVQDSSPSGFASGTNFAGATGLQRFFGGSDAKSIDLDYALKLDTTKISAHGQPVSGNNKVALDMVQLQFEKINFELGYNTISDSVYGFYDSIVTYVGSATNSAIVSNDSITAQFNAVEQEYFSISKVSIDEEMTNLIKYQTAYGAAAKVITTIDQMMDTLLGIKR